MNAGGTLNVLEAVHRGGHARVVLVSTREVYGSRPVRPDRREPSAAGPVAVLGDEDRGARSWSHQYHRSFNLPVAVVRPFNTYGPRQSARAVIPTVIRQALGGGPMQLGFTTPVRDLTFVSDTISGLIAAGNADRHRRQHISTSGTGEGFSVGDVAQTILRLMGSTSEIVLDPRRVRPRASEVDRLISDNSAFRQRTGWFPQVTWRTGLRAHHRVLSRDMATLSRRTPT